MSINVLFLNPPFKPRYSRSSRSPAVTKGGTLYYPLWLAYAAGAAEQDGCNVRLIDAPAQGWDVSECFRRLEGFVPDCAVIDTSTGSIFSDVAVAQALKEKYRSVYTVLVGTHPSALPRETLGLNSAPDAVAAGEYDLTVRDLARSLAGGKGPAGVPGLVYRSGKTIVVNPAREKLTDLDSLPFVSAAYKKHLSIRNYFFAAAGYPMVMIVTGRGCPYRCFFCVYPQTIHGRKYRTRSPENVADEFQYIRKELPEVREVGIEDDCFTADKARAARICELLIERKVGMKWYCNVRGDLDYPLLKLMKRAGCRLVTVGFESGCQAVLDAIPKGTKVEHYQSFAFAARKAGVLVHGCIMVGNPGDSPATLRQSYEFARKLNVDSMQFYPLYVYPGTEAYAWAEKHGYLKSRDFSQWNTQEGFHNCTLELPGLPSAEMLALCDYYLEKYHLRPEYLTMKLWQAVRDPAEGYRSLRSARFFFSKMLRKRSQ